MAARIRKKLLCRFRDGTRMYEVLGREVRDKLSPDFALGCHDKHCRYIPAGEIWIEKMPDRTDQCFNGLHERVERARMAAGEGYDRAHEVALGAEARARAAGRCRMCGPLPEER